MNKYRTIYKDYVKIIILFVFTEYPYNDFEKCHLISKKFEEKYGQTWSCSVSKVTHCHHIFWKININNSFFILGLIGIIRVIGNN